MQIKIGNKVIAEISANGIKCLEHWLESPKSDFQDHLINRVFLKMKRMFKEWIPILRERGLTIPAADDDLIDLITSQPDYKNKREREESVEGQTVKDICRNSGKLAKPTCPWINTRTIVFKEHNPNLPTENCDIH